MDVPQECIDYARDHGSDNNELDDAVDEVRCELASMNEDNDTWQFIEQSVLYAAKYANIDRTVLLHKSSGKFFAVYGTSSPYGLEDEANETGTFEAEIGDEWIEEVFPVPSTDYVTAVARNLLAETHFDVLVSPTPPQAYASDG